MTTLIHNPRCSKSRQTLALLEEHGISFDIVEYLKSPLDAEAIKSLITALDQPMTALVRVKEDEFKVLGIDVESLTEGALIDLLVSTPKLLERPIVVHGDHARIGRPPEHVLGLFE